MKKTTTTAFDWTDSGLVSVELTQQPDRNDTARFMLYTSPEGWKSRVITREEMVKIRDFCIQVVQEWPE